METQKIVDFYDSFAIAQLQGFITGNIRIDRAFDTLISNIPRAGRILEIGCGIGHISERLLGHYHNAEVYGLDISPKSIEIATALFGAEKIRFHAGQLKDLPEKKPFDLIVMVDVFEHISQEQRPEFFQQLKALLSSNAFLFLSCPSPEFLAWLRIHRPETIQPVDENITGSIIAELAESTATRLHLYKSVSIWFTGDYFHVVLGPNHVIEELPEIEGKAPTLFERLTGLPVPKDRILRQQRLQLIRSKLGDTVADRLKAE